MAEHPESPTTAAQPAQVMRWRWLPRQPLPQSEPLPDAAICQDDELIGAIVTRPEEMTAFRGSFPRLAALTPDPRFYRLVRVLNTPLASMSTKDAGRSGFAYWRGVPPAFRDDHRWAHFWFFDDGTDGDLVVAEYSFEGHVRLRSRIKSADRLAARYQELAAAMARGRA